MARYLPHFSFSDYYDPDHMGFRALRVINEDVVAAGDAFGMHGHQDMEIVTYVLEGAFVQRRHETAKRFARQIQRMSAGTGVRHSEFNASPTDPVHLLSDMCFRESEQPTELRAEILRGRRETEPLPHRRLSNGDEGSLKIHQDASIHLALVDAGKTVDYPLKAGRHAWRHKCFVATSPSTAHPSDKRCRSG
ncbi:MAG: pirin family protein [Gemmataceae bacterium]